MTIWLLLYVFPTMFYTWQMFNPYYERQTIDRYWYDQERQVLIDVARLKSNYDMDFMATVECESRRDWTLQSEVEVMPWIREDSHWLCQRNRRRHSDVLDNPRFENRYWQLSKCLEYYQWRKKYDVVNKMLYWYNVRWHCKQWFHYKYESLQDVKINTIIMK